MDTALKTYLDLFLRVNPQYRDNVLQAYGRYCEWCLQEGYEPSRIRDFVNAILSRGPREISFFPPDDDEFGGEFIGASFRRRKS